ncbi:MAG: twin-arginine translocase subunit TatC [Gemmatimonadetes bacterium]|nr:twin-arginine translocase subunit TatC [Gemmatimonadota bacterium]MYA41973.1 twin-arginine translocase subunit TatC [Gemmatimonadota bacterium]MYE94890.1 twin-arginine translocase subunit TatC [Gemmatimonadota bacterium]MYJ11768.1 twin-arginine translocase subunit TatC [Gemmatimonadota bacterium]
MNRLRDGLLSRGRRNPKAEMPFLDHLEELRWRILWSLAAIVAGFAIGLALMTIFDVWEILLEPGRAVFGGEWMPQVLAPTDPFFILLKVSLTIGLILASPTIIYQTWAFLAPALEKHEKRAIIPALYMGMVLFVAGVVLAYFVLPISLRFLTGLLTGLLEHNWTFGLYMGFVVKLLLAFGILFELPVVVLVLSILGLVTPAFLRSKRRHAIVIIATLAALLSPGDVIVVTVIMMVPIYLLFELSILMSVVIWRRREQRQREAEGETGGAVAPADPDPPPGAEPTPYDHGDPAREGDGDALHGSDVADADAGGDSTPDSEE